MKLLTKWLKVTRINITKISLIVLMQNCDIMGSFLSVCFTLFILMDSSACLESASLMSSHKSTKVTSQQKSLVTKSHKSPKVTSQQKSQVTKRNKSPKGTSHQKEQVTKSHKSSKSHKSPRVKDHQKSRITQSQNAPKV